MPRVLAIASFMLSRGKGSRNETSRPLNTMERSAATRAAAAAKRASVVSITSAQSKYAV